MDVKQGVEILKPVLETAEVLLVNREEAHGLVGKDLQDIKGLLADLKANGPQIVVITDGRDGSYASIDGREVWFCPVPLESPVVERTGCGDAYSTGFLAALVQGKELPEAMPIREKRQKNFQAIFHQNILLTYKKIQADRLL